MGKRFYDTNALLQNIEAIEGHIYLSSVTLHELENIKTSKNKDNEVKFNARKATRFLKENKDKYTCVVAGKYHYRLLDDLNLEYSNDNLIMACAYEMSQSEEVEFITNDICCYNIGTLIFGLSVSEVKEVDDNYKGYKEVIMTDDQLCKFYSLEVKDINTYDLLTGQYLIIKNACHEVVDAWRWDGLEYVPLSYKNTWSNQLGGLTCKDFYQSCALDSFYNNTITMIKGKAGSGKSHLAMNFLFSQLEKNKIDKIIMFINDVPVRGTTEHGFLPGTLEEKLTSGQIGNFLSGKLGDKTEITRLVSMGKLELLPMCDIRGFDTNGMNAGIYITEAQNMSIDLMKLALQRIGEDCVCIIDGDYMAQVDNHMFAGANNGMRRLSEIFRSCDEENLYGEMELPIIYRSKIASIADLM